MAWHAGDGYNRRGGDGMACSIWHGMQVTATIGGEAMAGAFKESSDNDMLAEMIIEACMHHGTCHAHAPWHGMRSLCYLLL